MKTTDATAYFGSKKKLAEALGISPSAVTMWGSVIPELRQFQLERLTNGALKASSKKAVA
ncbi:Cro/CI family transcriptional regulator [Azomonas macrocytogenes]|uniref:DNA-binding transcriptional regulator YdaS (Cro superfamily) n=1 Tax=Azomonas macrocytogenes TaxID=69962 RepID=A0A839T732_AZOMA|nr:Cro/CI family transcriptional regulator [Azomonas macrocytogenes]MBB3103765.1 DNA-binding transcriptional regulator YdaS (Cro superfamily) [Azomonas macrocytogenes]